MSVAFSLTHELRRKLKEPLGTLIQGPFLQTMKSLRDIVEKEKPHCIISVGDTVSRNLVKSRILPQLSIIDNVCMRKKVEQRTPPAVDQTVYVKNPQATITQEAITAIKDALNSNARTRIVVEGEEDLLTLIAVMYAPEDSLIIYGQPCEGIVAIRVTPRKKAEITGILNEMTKSSKS